MKLLNPLGIFRRALQLYDPNGSLQVFDAAMRVGLASNMTFPNDLIRLGLKMHIRGILNAIVVQSNRDWIWPYWIERQINPRDKSFIPRSHGMAHINMTHRNWTILGMPGRATRCIVDPRGLVTLLPEGWSLDFWLRTSESLHAPSRLKEVKQSIHARYPLIKTGFTEENIRVRSKTFYTETDGGDLIVSRVRIRNQGKHPVSGAFYYSIRPYNPEGVSLIHSIQFANGHSWQVDDRTRVLLVRAPQRVLCSNLRQGDVSLHLGNGDESTHCACDVGLVTSAAEYPIQLPPGGTEEFVALLKPEPAPAEEKKVWSSFRYDTAHRRFVGAWSRRLSDSAQFSFGSRLLDDSLNANRAYLHLFDQGDVMTPGALTYSGCWARDAAVMIHALDKMGFHEQARSKLAHFSSLQDRDGYFALQDGEWDSNGMIIWAVHEHYLLTRDREFLSDIYPTVLRAAEWIERKRGETAHKTAIHSGLLPAGISAEHLGPSDYYYWDNFWAVAGIRRASEIATAVGKDADARRLVAFAGNYWDVIQRTLHFLDDRLGAPLLPASPYRRVDSGAIGSMCAVYPLRLIDASAERVLNTIRILEEKFMFGGGFYQDHFHSGINSYLSAHLAQCYLAAHSPRVWKVIRYLLKQASPTYTWPEATHPATRGGSTGEGHHGWACAEWLLLLRNMLLVETEDHLVITPVLEGADLKKDVCISVSAAPTHFGKAAFRLSGDAKELRLALECEFSSPPAGIIWNLPFTPSAVYVDGKATPASSPQVHLSPHVRAVRVLK